MKNTPDEIFSFYKKSLDFKSSLGEKGLYEQNRINRRFFSGDQWHGAAVNSERPLVRHNIIKRIGDYKMGLLCEKDKDIRFFAEGINFTQNTKNDISKIKKELLKTNLKGIENITEKQKRGLICDALSSYYKIEYSRLHLNEKLAKLLTDSFVSGTGVLYSYWNSGEENPEGNVECEVLSCENVFFADNSLNDVNSQPFIVISCTRDTEEVRRQAILNGIGRSELRNITEDFKGSKKTTVLTKFFKENIDGKNTVKAVSVSEKCVIKPVYNTGLSRYPLNIFSWQERENCIFGESEITYLIPNQIAINRMITAQVWASMSMGMPIMTVNGDTVSGEITNDPGQIIKIYGSNEDVAGAVHFVTPPDFSENFERGISSLINNTLLSAGASGISYDGMHFNTNMALAAAKDAADVSAKTLKNRYNSFLVETALVWLDFCISKYADREICVEDENGRWFFPFEANDCKNLKFTALIKEKSDNREAEE